ncbi:FxSxx-COOH system tetratricopeptide repeat protein [Streptomyces phaeofaciens JCM 4814]|uniref:Cytochrome c n=1 Tax=Streptomyces phaeofaciens TaxID=68254 RepID=A0A918LY69_9ACTN|nr:FxSxx-COOH system tetratricopeptide repeat protein [Streptomyces phaeofaciens]GGT73133.1 cytochrome c [Streptomyces phaeofaciens]
MDGSRREHAPGPDRDGTGSGVVAHSAQEPPGTDGPPTTPRWQELADAVWLSAYWTRTGRITSADPALPDKDEQPVGPVEPMPLPPRDELPSPGPPTGTAPQPVLTPDPEGPERVQLGAPALPTTPRGPRGPNGRSAGLARSLHRLARQVPSRDTLRLDEEVTAERGIHDELWMPWFRPADGTAFDLALLVDGGPTMPIWEQEVSDLSAAAEHSGAFRAVRTVRLVLPPGGEPKLRWNAAQTMADPGEILSGRGDRIFLVVTDGLGHGWAAPAADRLLDRLGRAGPTALVHLLPPHMRHRSSLYPHAAVLEAGGFGAANQRLGLGPPPSGPDPMRPLPGVREGALPVPVLSLKAGSVAAWADLVVGDRGVRRRLPVVRAGALRQGAPAPGLRAPRRARAAASAVHHFFTLATPSARRLATQLAAAPFDFDLVDQLRRRTMPESGPEHLAEILMGGLIEWGDHDTARPEFASGVREALLATTTRTQLATIVAILGELPAAGRHGVALRAALRDPARAPLSDVDVPGWRQSELAVMRALAGPYSERADRIEADRGSAPADPGSRPETPLARLADAPGRGSSLVRGAATPSHLTEHAMEAWPGMKRKSAEAPALLVNVPLRNTTFVGRHALLRAVEDQLAAQDTAAVLPHALHGLGGVGKSQLVLEYIYTHQHDHKVICWIPAERESLVLAALATLAAQLGVAPTERDSMGVPAAGTAVPAVLEALRTGAPYDDWLLVFDNAEDVEMVRRFFPPNGPGKIIVTSRNRAWERVATPLPVDVFERGESVELLQKRSPGLSADAADRLAEALGDLPLAVEQAGTWHAVTGMPVDEYLDLLDQRSPEILDLDPAPDYPVSVAAAWDISLERLKENNPGARQLLDICASMAPEPIPRSMLRGSRGVNITPEIDPLLRESIKLNRAVRDLSQFSLVKVDPRSDSLQMHRLLQTVLLAKLSPGEREQMRDAAHQLLSAAKPGPYGSSFEWRAYQALLPHVLTSQAVTSTDTYVRELVFDTLWFLYYWGDHLGAADFARQAWTAWLGVSGEEDIHVIRMTKSLGFLLRQIGQVPESIPLSEQALEVSRRIDVDPEEMVDSLCELADARGYQGRFEEARDLAEEATELARSLFGTDDPTTLRATHSWGVDLRLCGNFTEALQLDQETARLRDLLFGPANFFTLNSLNAVTLDMLESGAYTDARDFQEDVHRRARTALGDDNPLTLRIARTLAVCRRRDGALAEAAKLADATLRRFTARYGTDHFDSLQTATNLSVDLRLAGDLDSSRQLAESTARSYARHLGENHAYTLLTQANLAATLRALGILDRAQELEDHAARRLGETVGPRHVTTLTVAVGRANTAYARLDFEQAHAIDDATAPLLGEIAGEGHPLSLACTANLSLDLRGMGRGAEADALQRRATEGLARVVRSDHPWLVATHQRRRIECDLSPVPL